MSEFGRYCCFTCPEHDQTIKSLDDNCPSCGRPYGFPLQQAPKAIGDYDVERSIGRGFYATTYVARPRQGLNRAPRVLKVSPVAVYEKFGKSFADEMRAHAEAADGADHVVEALDVFDATVDFGDVSMPCHVAVLQFVDGDTLSKYLRGDRPLSAAQAAQVACDLFRMREEFVLHKVHHNDLHASNIIVQELPPARRRADAIEPSIRAVAIDLGSVAEDRRSGGDYVGDLHWIGKHVNAMAECLLARGDSAPDLDKRVGLQLQIIAQSIASVTENQRTPAAEDMIAMIREQYHRTAEPWRPWRNQAVLKTFAASYNAQTLDAWYVPQLLIDPEGTWLSRVSAPGPLVMTGMRGCGKTMLLQSLQFHARATVLPGESDQQAIERIGEDGYVGLFISAQRLIPADPKATRPSTEELLARLLVAYAVQAARAMAHLQDLDPDLLAFDASALLIGAVVDTLSPRPEIAPTTTLEQLERAMSDLLIRVSRNDSGIRLATNPNIAFPLLSNAVRRSSPIWQHAQVLFLLDDVSTRYLDADRIEDLLSSLLFQHTECAFKLTSEAQTIFLSLKSPGKVHPAAAGRDFATFDLGAEVQNRLKDRSGRTFLNDILDARAKLFPGHPNQSSTEVLGDVDLETIARTIVETQSQNRSRERKRLYHGIRALAGVCVGDIGTVIQIYQEMLAGNQTTLPISPERQHEVFRDFCARHLYSLDRRQSDLKTVALQFAEASHHLLVESGKGKPTGRIRQYTSLYVRVTTGDVQAQMSRLRELVDAGVFVFTGGTARTKTHDSDPVQQFKLTFRKIYGLANFIGLSDRDRFELSGEDLERWLGQPGAGREILLRNLSKSPIDEDADDVEALESNDGSPKDVLRGLGKAKNRQTAFPEFFLVEDLPAQAPTALPDAEAKMPEVRELGDEELKASEVDDLILGLGFEERAPESLKRLLALVKPRNVLAVRYPLDGNAEAMLGILRTQGIPVQEIAYEDHIALGSLNLNGSTLIDLTGLAKPALYRAVRSGLTASKEILISYTPAVQYYPLESDLRQVLQAAASDDEHLLLTALRGVVTGETGPYRSVPLSNAESDGTRLRALSAFASPRHERLLHLASEREFDALQIMTDHAKTSRARVGTIAARVALEDTPKGTILSVDAKDLSEVVGHLVSQHGDWYVRGGLDYEIGLTGSKLQAAAAAIVASVLPVNQVWYVQPEHFDQMHFSSGVGTTRHFRVSRRTGPYGG